MNLIGKLVLTASLLCLNCGAAFAMTMEKRTPAEIPEVVSICKKYGVGTDLFVTEHNGNLVMPNGKKFPLAEIRWVKIVEGETEPHPFNEDIKITVDSIVLESAGNQPFIIGKYTVNNKGNSSKAVTLSTSTMGLGFPAKVGNCYFVNASYGTVEGDAMALQAVDKKSGKKTEILIKHDEWHHFDDGSKLRITGSTSDVHNFRPKFSGPAVNIEYMDKDAATSKFLIIKNRPDLNPKELPFTLTLENLGDKAFLALRTFCD